MSIEELGLRLSTVASLSIPVLCSEAIECTGTRDSDVGSCNRNERTSPFLVTKGRSAGEGNDRSRLQLGEVKNASGRNSKAVDSNRSATRNS